MPNWDVMRGAPCSLPLSHCCRGPVTSGRSGVGPWPRACRGGRRHEHPSARSRAGGRQVEPSLRGAAPSPPTPANEGTSHLPSLLPGAERGPWGPLPVLRRRVRDAPPAASDGRVSIRHRVRDRRNHSGQGTLAPSRAVGLTEKKGNSEEREKNIKNKRGDINNLISHITLILSVLHSYATSCYRSMLQ